MSFDLTGRALFPLGDLIASSDFPLAEYLPVDAINQVFDNLYYTDATLYTDGENKVFDIRLVWEGELALLFQQQMLSPLCSDPVARE